MGRCPYSLTWQDKRLKIEGEGAACVCHSCEWFWGSEVQKAPAFKQPSQQEQSRSWLNTNSLFLPCPSPSPSLRSSVLIGMSRHLWSNQLMYSYSGWYKLSLSVLIDGIGNIWCRSQIIILFNLSFAAFFLPWNFPHLCFDWFIKNWYVVDDFAVLTISKMSSGASLDVRVFNLFFLCFRSRWSTSASK